MKVRPPGPPGGQWPVVAVILSGSLLHLHASHHILTTIEERLLNVMYGDYIYIRLYDV